MALNWTMLDAHRAPVPLPDEMFIRTVESGPEITLVIPGTPERKLKEPGRLWLTDKRVRLLYTACCSALMYGCALVDFRVNAIRRHKRKAIFRLALYPAPIDSDHEIRAALFWRNLSRP